VKIYINQIPPEGLTLAEKIRAGALDLDTSLIKLEPFVLARADVQRGINCLSARLALQVKAKAVCSRCLSEFQISLDKETDLNFPLDKTTSVIDITDDIREAIMLDYPIKPLCKPGCLGLCPVCGTNLNEKKCGCKFV